MAQLDWISIRGFKSIASIEKLRLGHTNVVIGANGSGKSNFIGVFSFLHALKEGHLEEYVLRAGGANKVLHFGAKVSKAVSIHVSFGGEVNQYQINLVPTSTDELIPLAETAYFWDKATHPDRPYSTAISRVAREAGISGEPRTGVEKHVRQHFDGWRVYHFHDTSRTSPMKATADIHDNSHFRADGSNLAAFLYLVKQKHRASYDLIRSAVQRVAPFFDDFQLAPQRLNPEKIRLEWKHAGSEDFFDASSLSDGTLRFVALAVLFLQPTEHRPSVILADEPELGLHPYAITMLASLIKQAAVGTQVIVSTQSPLLLDNFSPEHILVAERSDGGTQLNRLDVARLESWLEDYSLGELWEKNELGGRPSADERRTA